MLFLWAAQAAVLRSTGLGPTFTQLPMRRGRGGAEDSAGGYRRRGELLYGCTGAGSWSISRDPCSPELTSDSCTLARRIQRRTYDIAGEQTLQNEEAKSASQVYFWTMLHFSSHAGHDEVSALQGLRKRAAKTRYVLWRESSETISYQSACHVTALTKHPQSATVATQPPLKFSVCPCSA